MANSVKCFQEVKKAKDSNKQVPGNLEGTADLQGSCFFREERGARLRAEESGWAAVWLTQ